MTKEEVSNLSDAYLTRAVVGEVMDFSLTWREIQKFDPLTDANDRDRVVERLREVWEVEYFIDTDILMRTDRDDNGFIWNVQIDEWGFENSRIDVFYANLGRAICEAALLDRTENK
jgi:hypothetical protein